MAEVPHLKVPFSLSGSSFATVEQDSPEEIEQCVLACVSTIVGTRIDALDYGIPDETFEQQGAKASVERIFAAVQVAEPRARLLGEARTEDLIKRVVLTPEVMAQ